MSDNRYFHYNKAQIENFLKREFEKSFKGTGRISIRKRQKFMDKINKKVGRQFGKDVLCLIDFNRQGFTTLVSPSHQESTHKGRLFRSFVHPQVAYTSHCVDRFSQRTGTTDNCVIALDDYLDEALLTYGFHKGYLVCRHGVFAFVLENDRLVIKTFISSEMLSEEQVRQFYGWDVVSAISPEIITEDDSECDFLLSEDQPSSTPSGDL